MRGRQGDVTQVDSSGRTLNVGPSRISAIVVTFNGSKTIGECLDSLRNSRHHVQIIVVDNASTDGTSALVPRTSDITCLPQAKNLGFGRANNIGMRHAFDQGDDYVFLLNQDARVSPDTIGELLRVAGQNPAYGILSPLHLNGEGTQIDELVAHYILAGNPKFFSDSYFGRIGELYDIPFINAAAWLVSRNCLDRVGGFDDLFFLYGEDQDYCARALRRGLRIGLAPGATAFHRRIVNVRGGGRWANAWRITSRSVAVITVKLKTREEGLAEGVVLWGVDHKARMLKEIVRGDLREFILLLIVGVRILVKLPAIWSHRKRSSRRCAAWF